MSEYRDAMVTVEDFSKICAVRGESCRAQTMETRRDERRGVESLCWGPAIYSDVIVHVDTPTFPFRSPEVLARSPSVHNWQISTSRS
jgi:hypothetical protein